MALSMSRPWKHPKTAIYWLRKRVPDDLRAVVGLRAGPRELSEHQAHELARPVHDWWLSAHRDNPSDQVFWNTALAERLWAPPDLSHPFKLEMDADSITLHQLERWCQERASEVLVKNGLRVDEESRFKLAKAVAAAVQRASLSLARLARGEPDGLLLSASPPLSLAVPQGNAAASSTTFDELVDGWGAEAQPAEKTRYEWTRVVGQFAKFLGHRDAGRIKADDLIAWKAQLVGDGLRPKTIRDAKLAPVRAILQWGVDNKRLGLNAAKGVTIDVKVKASESKRSFRDDEARKILKAALNETDPVRRWVPWLCAYSGARVSEVCQLRVDDIVRIDSIWCMKIDPEAGDLKTVSAERIVPLHPAIKKVGFLEFVKAIKSGPLFSELPPDRFGSRGGNGTKVIGRWVRSLGLTDKRLSPNHSWRHRWKTLARVHGLALDVVDAICGHRRRTVADSYGEYPVDALFRELAKIPPLDLGAGSAVTASGCQL